MTDFDDTSVYDAYARPRRWRRAAIIAVGIGAVFLVVAFVAALIPVFPFTLFEHFRVQYIVVGAVLAAAAAGLRHGGWCDTALLTTLATIVLVVPGLRAAPRPMPATGVGIRLLLVNVHTSSRSFAKVAKLITDTDPDVIALLEVDHGWREALAPALAAYGGRLEVTRTDNFGIALYARGRVEGAPVHLGSDVPTLVAGVAVGEARFSVIVTHLMPPVSTATFAEQRDQVAAVAAVANQLAPPVIVAGDLNATPWSSQFVRLAAATGLCDTRNGFGVQATFPTWNPILRIPIDHVLTSCSIGVADRRVERAIDSDHFPVVVDLVIPACPHGRWCD